MYGNAAVRRFLLNNLTVGTVSANTTKAVTVDLTADVALPLGCGIVVTPRAALAGKLTCYGVRSDNNTLLVEFVNASAADVVAADTVEYDVFVFLPTGELQQSV